MIEYELNDSYRKLINTIDKGFNEVIFSGIKKRLNKVYDKIIYLFQDLTKYYRISSDFNIRKGQIEDIIEKSKSSYKKAIAGYREEAFEACRNFYNAIKEIVKIPLPKDEKNKIINIILNKKFIFFIIFICLSK